jgi:hypothetical protein
MTYAFYYDAPGNPKIYGMVSEQLGSQPPQGLVVQVVTSTGHGLRHLQVWESRREWETFRDSRVGPAVSAVLERLGIPTPAGPPEEHVLDLVDVLPAAALV